MTDPAPTDQDELAEFLGQDVVLDTRGELLYVGKLAKIGHWFFTLEGADVHDLPNSRTSKEVYLIEAAKYGIKKNRHSVVVRKAEVVSLSLLSQVILY